MGYDSLKAIGGDEDSYLAKQVLDVRLRMDGLFELEEHAVQFVEEFIALYTNGPAGGGGIRYWQVIFAFGHREEAFSLVLVLVFFWPFSS